MPQTIAKDETLRLRVPRGLWDSIHARAVQQGTTRSEVARGLLETALGATRSVDGTATLSIPIREAVLIHIDSINDLLERVAVIDPKEAVRISMDAAIAFSRWSQVSATELGSTPEAIYQEGIRS